MRLCNGYSIVMDDDTPTLLLMGGVDVYAEFDVKTKTWIKNCYLTKPDFMWRPISELKVLEITEGLLPSPADFDPCYLWKERSTNDSE